MKASELESFDKISDLITNVADCTETAKKLLVILNKQRNTLKESAFNYMVKELRYELLQILEKMEPKADVDAQKTKDDLERDVFMVCCETMTDELKTVAIREEWSLQQKHMAEMQNLVHEINYQLSLHNKHYLSQGSILIGILSRVLEDDAGMNYVLDSPDLPEALQSMARNLLSFFSSQHCKECTCTNNSDGIKCSLAICTSVLNISKNEKGRQFLLQSCSDAIQSFILSFPLLKCRPAEKLKFLLLELFLNLTDGDNILTDMKNFHFVFDSCLNQEHQNNDIIQISFELLDKVISKSKTNAAYEQFLTALKCCVTPATLQKHALNDAKVKFIANKILPILKSGGKYEVFHRKEEANTYDNNEMFTACASCSLK